LAEPITATTDAVPSGRIGEVDALRCFAMAAVVAIHSSLLPFGWMGVWLFYVISGFVVTSSLMHRPTVPHGRWLAAFYTRRASRILPVYAVYIAAGLIFALLTARAIPLTALASMAGFFNNFAMMAGVGELKNWPTGHLWTISVEMQFYAVFGLAFVFLPRRWLIASLIALLFVAPALRGLTGWHLAARGVAPLQAAFDVYASSYLHFDAFAAGALLALFRSEIAARRLEAWIFGAGCLAMAIYVAAYVSVNLVIRDRHGIEIVTDIISGIVFGEGREVGLYSALALLNAGVLIWTASGRAPWSGVTRIRLLQRIGETSYGAYIFHALAITLTAKAMTAVPGFAHSELILRVPTFMIALAAAILMAEVSYRYLEKPIIRWTGRVLSKSSPA
jgi:peptidoglycan/LPS O-acetylase OafA/YrhL